MDPTNWTAKQWTEWAEKITGGVSYDDIIALCGKTLVRTDDNDYQGDTYALLKRRGKYAYLQFGWGSCSGCDALEACCGRPKKLGELAREMFTGLIWRTPRGMEKWLENHDWRGDYCWRQPAFKEFLPLAKEAVASKGKAKETEPAFNALDFLESIFDKDSDNIGEVRIKWDWAQDFYSITVLNLHDQEVFVHHSKLECSEVGSPPALRDVLKEMKGAMEHE